MATRLSNGRQTIEEREMSGRIQPLPDDRLERVWAWGQASSSVSHVYRPTSINGVRRAFAVARRSGRSLGFRGGGNSYGDAAMNAENVLLDLRRMNRILDWDPDTGLVRVEPGVTLAQLWQYTLEDGWWPPVVTGTMQTTLGGCAAMNVHGKNAWQVGPIGDHIVDFDLLLASGDIISCSRESHPDLFHAAIGGLGMLGCFVSLTLRLKRIYSGFLNVRELATPTLESNFDQFASELAESDYIVGWLDATARGDALGRGQIHIANYLAPGEDPYPAQSLRLDRQHLPDTFFGVVPRSAMWRPMRLFMNNAGVPFINTAQYYGARFRDGRRYRQSHVAFHFLLDYIPDWKKAYGPGGLIQYQSFVPATAAPATFRTLIEMGQAARLPNYLSVLKRHRPDDFWLTHGLDGYSLAMDFKVTSGNRQRLLALTRAMDEVVLSAAGRFYPAKDSTLRPEVARAYLGQEVLERFGRLRAHYDPDGLLATNFWRRVIAPA